MYTISYILINSISVIVLFVSAHQMLITSTPGQLNDMGQT